MSKREEDLRMLADLLDDHPDELSVREVEAFANMRFELTAGYSFHQLTEKQRTWVFSTHQRIVPETANLVSRGLVPRGREVAPAKVLLDLPKSPPPLPKPIPGRGPQRSSRRHCGNEDNGCYAFVNGDCACDCCRR